MLTNLGTIAGNLSNAGTATNNGVIIGSVTNSGTLGGGGTVVGNLSSCGVMAPGNSIGTVTVTGNFTQTASGTFRPRSSARARATASMSAAQRRWADRCSSAHSRHGLRAPTTYTIVNAAGGLSRHLRRGQRALSLPAVDPELRRQQRLSQPGGRRLRGAAATPPSPPSATCSTPTPTPPPATSPPCWAPWPSTVQQPPGAGLAAGDLGQQLRRLLVARWSRAPSSS